MKTIATVLLALIAATAMADEERVYTNDDLDRLFPLREVERVFPPPEVKRSVPAAQDSDPGSTPAAGRPAAPAPVGAQGLVASRADARRPPVFPYHRQHPLHSKKTPRYVPGELLIKFEDHASPAERARIKARLGVVGERHLGGGTEHLKLGPGRNTEQAVRYLDQQPGVRYAEPNYIIHALDSSRSRNKSRRIAVD